MASTSGNLSIVIPAYNEAATLLAVVQRVVALPHVLEVVLVDDCSTDGTGKIADEVARLYPKVQVTHHPVNRGKTEALKTGFAQTRGDIVIVQDADLEYDPNDYLPMLTALRATGADVVYGSRTLGQSRTERLTQPGEPKVKTHRGERECDERVHRSDTLRDDAVCGSSG